MSGSPKNNQVLFIVLVAFRFFSFSVNAQRIPSIKLYPTNTSVVIKFTISAGASCSGYTILHSLDSLTYNEAGSEPGICGSTTEIENKSFTHLTPVFNKVNYYKVRLEPYVETSFSKSVFVAEQGAVKMRLYPNPCYTEEGELKIQILTKDNLRFKGHIYNQNGKSVKDLDVTTEGDTAVTSVSELNNGLYIIWLTDGAQVFTCKLIIMR